MVALDLTDAFAPRCVPVTSNRRSFAAALPTGRKIGPAAEAIVALRNLAVGAAEYLADTAAAGRCVQQRGFLPMRTQLRLAATALFLSAVVAGAPAFAAESMAKDSMSKDSMAKDSMAKDSMKKDSMAKDAMSKDSMAKDSMAKDSTKK